MCAHAVADPYDNAVCMRYATDPAHHSHKGAQKSTWVTKYDYGFWQLGARGIRLGKNPTGNHWQGRLTPHMVSILNPKNLPDGVRVGQSFDLLKLLSHKEILKFRATSSEFGSVVADRQNLDPDCNRSDMHGMLLMTQSVSPEHYIYMLCAT